MTETERKVHGNVWFVCKQNESSAGQRLFELPAEFVVCEITRIAKQTVSGLYGC